MSLRCGIVGLPNVGKSTLFNALTKSGIAAENYPFCTIEPNVGIVEVPDSRLGGLAAIEKSAEGDPGGGRVRGHRRPGCGRIQGRGPRQPVPRQHPRNRRHRARGALLRGSERDPCGEQDRPAFRHRSDQYRAGAGGSCCRREATVEKRQGRQNRRRQGSAAPGRGAGEGDCRARPRQAGALGGLVEGRVDQC